MLYSNFVYLFNMLPRKHNYLNFYEFPFLFFFVIFSTIIYSTIISICVCFKNFLVNIFILLKIFQQFLFLLLKSNFFQWYGSSIDT